MRVDVVGFELDETLQVGDGRLQLSLFTEGNTQDVVSVYVIRLQLQSSLAGLC